MEVSPGTLIHDRYRLQCRLGRGAFGEVWSAHDEVADVDVALKIYVALDDKGIEEFRSEFRNVINLVHTNILRPEYYDVSDSRPFLVMPLCRGSVETQSGSMSESDLWRFIRDVSSGLAYLHSHDILHRDIKPANILINADGDYVISDFGISTRMRSTMRRSSMRQDKGMDTSGTIAYMAPELFTKSPSAVKATDIWALGATLYELMTGELLFFGQGGVVQLKGAELPELPDRYSQDLRETVASCLSMDTWSRPTASELMGYVESMLKGKKVRKPWKDREARSRSSKKKWIWLTMLLLLIISGSFVGYRISLDKQRESSTVGELHSDGVRDLTPHYVGDDNDDSSRKSSSAEISLQCQKDSLAKVELEQHAREEYLRHLQDSLGLTMVGETETAVRATTGTLNGHEWVDLGLSVLWATCNVGASSPSEYGNYYAWGETTTKSSYTLDNSRTYEVGMGDISGNPSYDAATANWGEGWRMPTKKEFEELLNKCDWEWTSQDGRNGYKVTDPNGNSIFLPATGLRYGASFNRLGSYYWSSTPDGGNTQYACSLYIFNDLCGVDWYYRGYGRSVRPVLDK